MSRAECRSNAVSPYSGRCRAGNASSSGGCPFMIPSGEPTRVIFGNIAYGWLVYIFAVAMAVAFGWGCYRRFRLWRQGREAFRLDRPWDRVKALFGHGFGHQRLIKDAYP